MNHKPFINHAIEIAFKSRTNGNHPFGAILVSEGRVLLTAENTVVSSRDVTRHSELNLISQASQQFDRDTLSQSTLYTSTEPCAMCAGAIYWSGIRSVVFGLPAEELADFASGSFIVKSADIFSHGKEHVSLKGPFSLEASRKVHENFWKKS